MFPCGGWLPSPPAAACPCFQGTQLPCASFGRGDGREANGEVRDGKVGKQANEQPPPPCKTMGGGLHTTRDTLPFTTPMDLMASRLAAPPPRIMDMAPKPT